MVGWGEKLRLRLSKSKGKSEIKKLNTGLKQVFHMDVHTILPKHFPIYYVI